jgi:heat-inducible transcriptional repressor
VQNSVLHTTRAFSQAELVEATNMFNQHFAGLPFAEVRTRLAAELRALREDIASLMNAAVEAGEGALAAADDVVVAGQRNLLSGEMVTNMDRLKRLFEVFEQKTSLMHLLDVSQNAQGVQIYIGGESGLVPLDEMSVVTAPYELDGQVIGTVGVIGPTRMAYERVIPIVDVTARLLSHALDKQLGS